MLAKLITTAVVAAQLGGCAGYDLVVQHQRGAAPWDPRPGQSLLDQIPSWDHAAALQCGGHLRPTELTEHHSLRC